MGVEYFENNHDFDELRDPKVPPCFLFIYNCFLEIYNCSGESITWTDILNYAIIRKIDFRQIEIDYILKCNNWANVQIKQMRDENKQG